MKFLLLVTVLNQAEPNHIHDVYETYADCVSAFNTVESKHPVKLECSNKANYIALVINNLDEQKEKQHSIHYSYKNCQQAIRELELDYSYTAYCTQYN